MHHAGARLERTGCHATVGETGILCGLEQVQEAQSIVAYLVSHYVLISIEQTYP